MTHISWTREKAAHLFRRAGFGGLQAEIDKAVSDGLEATVDSLVNYEMVSNAALEERLRSIDVSTQRGPAMWWLVRMLETKRPLEERLTFFWHDHFATAIQKVRSPEMMLAQNRLLRSFATGNFRELAVRISKDPAMLIWLDNWLSRKEQPNENYARELLELFILGIGHYSELDVMSAAKAFTGWTLTRNADRAARTFVFNDSIHDHSQKDFLGRVGDWNGEDIVRIACGEFAHGQLIASKLLSYFAYENPEQSVVDDLARLYLDNDTNIKPLVRAILVSPEMYSDQAIWGKFKSPLEASVIATRQLLAGAPVNDRDLGALVRALNVQEQMPFNPPDVAGWDSGPVWISSSSLLTRMNLANYFTSSFDVPRFTAGRSDSTAPQMVDGFADLLGPVPLPPDTRDKLIAYVAPGGAMPSGSALVVKQRGLAHMILSLPEWQLN